MTNTDVLIIGAGPTGLTAGVILARYGVNFRIVDKKSGPTHQSRALGVQARTLELWDKLELAEGAVANGQPAVGFNLLSEKMFAEQSQDGDFKSFVRLSEEGDAITPYPYMLVYEQYKTENMLVDDLNARCEDCIRWDTEIVALAVDGNSVQATLRHNDGREETVNAAYIIGADGASSYVRKSMSFTFEGETYEDTLFLADVQMDWSLPRDKMFAEFPRYGLLNFFPMRGDGYSDKQYRIIGAITPEIRDKQATDITKADLQRLLDRYSVTDARIETLHYTSIYRIHSRMTDQFRQGRVFLAGDAAHIHSPAGGQGMNTGIQDAYNLAWKLALVVTGQADASLLDSYEQERMPVARAVLSGTDKGFSFIGSSNYWMHLARQLLMPHIPGLISRFRLSGRIFGLISQTWINYRESSIVDGNTAAEAALPGDRAPYAQLNNGESIFSLLRGVHHHLLIFVNGSVADAAEAELANVLSDYSVAAQIHTLAETEQALRQAYDVRTPTVFFIRPDGHIAWRGDLTHIDGLRSYLNSLYRPAQDAGTTQPQGLLLDLQPAP